MKGCEALTCSQSNTFDPESNDGFTVKLIWE